MKLPFEAVVIRYVHDVCAGEFLNVGVVLLCPEHSFAGARFLSQWGRISMAFPGADLVLLRRVARAFQRRCNEWTADANGQLTLDPIADLKSLLSSVMVPDSSSVQFSPPIGGVSADAERTLADLFHVYVGAAVSREERASRDDSDVWRDFTAKSLPSTSLLKRLQRHTLHAPHYDLQFDVAWKNGTWNVAQPLSFDLIDPRTIRDKAAGWTGKLLTVMPHESANVFLLIGMPRSAPAVVTDAARDAVAILRQGVGHRAQVLTEDHGEKLAAKITADLAAHEDED